MHNQAKSRMKGLIGGLVHGPDQFLGACGIERHVSSRLLTNAWGCSQNVILAAGAASMAEVIKQLSSLQSLNMRYVGCGSERVWRGGGIGG